jgi:hypothetical protein
MAQPTTTDFLEAVNAGFGFLVSELGFVLVRADQIPLATFPTGRQPIDVARPLLLQDRATFAEFTNEAITVKVVNDPRGELQVTISSKRAGSAQDADLYHILKYQSVPTPPEGWVYDWGTTTLHQAAIALGEALSTYGRAFLADAPDAWKSLWEWRLLGQPGT